MFELHCTRTVLFTRVFFFILVYKSLYNVVFKNRIFNVCFSNINVFKYLFKEHGEIEAFGNDAVARFADLDKDQQESWYFFQNFKMRLYGDNVRFVFIFFFSFFSR